MKPSSQKILVAGGSGFLGSYVVSALSKQGYQVIVPTRRWNNARHLLPLPNVEVVKADILREHSKLSSLLAQSTAVINLIGILHGKGRQVKSAQGGTYNEEFYRVKVEWPKKLVAAISLPRESKITHLIHVSALGVAKNAPSEYLRAKADGEEIVCKASVNTTILRPSIIAGINAPFFNMMNNMINMLPVIIMPSLDFVVQPVCVSDVAKAIVLALHNSDAYGKTYDLAGPEKFTLAELVHTLAAYQGKSRIVLNMPKPIANIMAFLLEFLPNPPMSRDNLLSMTQKQTTEKPFPFKINPQAIAKLFQRNSYEQDMKHFRTTARR